MGYNERIGLGELAGETLTYIDVDPENDVILLTTESGRMIKIYHEQDCCESVRIEDTQGDWHNLIGKVIVTAYADEYESEVEYGSRTETTLTFCVDDATVINRWVGESNGYYSESVHIEEIANQE